jgi:hypothetical protein
MHIPSEDDGADSVIKLVKDDSGVCDRDGRSSNGGGKSPRGAGRGGAVFVRVLVRGV